VLACDGVVAGIITSGSTCEGRIDGAPFGELVDHASAAEQHVVVMSVVVRPQHAAAECLG
jgi:hypothetical protein